MSTEPVKAILKEKREYLIRLESHIAAWKKTDAEAKRKAREEFPSDDETVLPQNKQQQTPKKASQQSKRRRLTKRKSIEEEIVAPKLSDYGNPRSW